MIAGALFYYQGHSWRNRLLMRLRRLKQPKYLAGAVVGGLYFYFYLFRGLARGRAGAGASAPISAEMEGMAETLAALGFMVFALMAWILPHSRAALGFSEAEVAFLFPAPIGRRTLLNFKILKSQAPILFSAVIMTLIRHGVSGPHFVFHTLGWWAALSVFNLHLLGSSFTITLLMDRGISNWKRRILFLGVAAACVAGVALWAWHSIPPLPAAQQRDGFAWIFHYVAKVFESGPLPWLLMPFRLVVAPYFASTVSQFLTALLPVLGILLLHYFWVVGCNVTFEEASVELSRKMAERIAAARENNWQGARKLKKASRAPFTLRPVGHPAVAVLWKNLISAGQYVTLRMWLFLAWIAVITGAVLQMHSGRGAMGGAIAIFVVMLLAMSLFSGPQMLRNDLRQDLPVADVLKMLPIPGWQVVLGEVLAPVAMLAGAQWLLIAFGAIFFPAQLERHAIPVGIRLSVAAAAAMVLPLIDLVAVLIPNAAVLFFPAWFQLGKEAPRGFETMGQNLILMVGQMLVLVLTLVLPGAAFALAVFGASLLQWPALGIVLGGFAAALLLAIEAGLGVKLLGRVFERFDVSGETLVS